MARYPDYLQSVLPLEKSRHWQQIWAGLMQQADATGESTGKYIYVDGRLSAPTSMQLVQEEDNKAQALGYSAGSFSTKYISKLKVCKPMNFV